MRLARFLLAPTLFACATTSEDIELPETIVDGSTDSWGYPTKFGTLFEETWQFGELDPSRNLKFPAWTFDLSGDAKVTLTSRKAPTDEPDLTSSVIYLYKQRDAGTFQRIAKSTSGSFGTLARDLGEGTYRVIVKGHAADDAGQFMLRLDCTGGGCASDQCLVGSTFHENTDIKEGALIDYGSKLLTITSEMSPELKAQIIEAVRQSSHTDVMTIEDAFDRVDQNEVYRYRFWDNLLGRSLFAIEYGAGDNSYGAFFVEDSATPVAAIHDGDIDNCTLQPRACAFGQHKGDAAFMPNMRKTSERTLTQTSSIDAVLEKQIIKAVQYDAPITLAQAFENVDDNTIYTQRLSHTDGRKFVVVHYYAGDTAVGTYFAAGSDVPLATISDGEIVGCTELL